MFSIQCEELRIIHLIPLLVGTIPYACGSCGGQMMLRTSSDIFIFNLELCLEGFFLKEVYFEGPNRV
jgi:hypothetical protein